MNFDLPPVVRYILIFNLVFFGLEILVDGFVSYSSLYYVNSTHFYPFQIVTYMFTHADIGHIFGNMLAVFFFGPLLERVWGPKRFLIFYLTVGVSVAVLYLGIQYGQVLQMEMGMNEYIANPNPDSFAHFFRHYAPKYYEENLNNVQIFAENPTNPTNIKNSIEVVKSVFFSFKSLNGQMLGASGAVFGILIAFAMLFPNTEMMLLFFPFPIKAKYFVTLYLAYEVWKLYERDPNDNVSHLGHVGGALIGFIIVKIWQRNRRTFY
jgi:membrane associated rhomboid family serine protease